IIEVKLLTFAVAASDPDLPPQTLTYALGGATSGATIHPTTGIFSWQPSETQGGTTNTISVLVTDNGPPPMSATQTFSVIVLDTQPDFVLGIGSTQLLSGASATVPFKLQSGLDLTNVQWVLAINNDRLTNLALQNLAGQVGTAELLPLGSNRYFARFASRP